MYVTKKGQAKACPFFFRESSIVSFVIIFVSSLLLYFTFTFDIVPPILNRGIQPATFPKALLVFIIFLTLIIIFINQITLEKREKLPFQFYITLTSLIVFILVSKFFDFFRNFFACSNSCLLLGRKKINLYNFSKYYFSNYRFYIF